MPANRAGEPVRLTAKHRPVAQTTATTPAEINTHTNGYIHCICSSKITNRFRLTGSGAVNIDKYVVFPLIYMNKSLLMSVCNYSTVKAVK